jgi:hypothetical protein
MRRPLFMLAAMLLAGAMVFISGYHFTARWCATHVARPTDDLDWLRLEFRLTDTELARVRQLHEGYLPICRGYCERIAARKQELQPVLSAGTNAVAVIEKKLMEIGALRAQCQSAMLQHFREVSAVMPPEQGRRYLAEMQRLTLGFHDQIERSMSPDSSESHGHH